MPLLRLAVAQSHTLSTTAQTLTALQATAQSASARSVDLLLFPEAYLGGYPIGATFGATVGSRTAIGREQYLRYFQNAVDLGDTPEGAGRAWVERLLENPRNGGQRGDGTREQLESIAKETGVFLVVGVVEQAAGSLYCAVVYVCPFEGIIGKRRKVMPTGTERIIWGQGQPSSLRAVTTTIRDVKLTLAAAICWENYMPLLRQSLYCQNVNLYLAPTADGRDTWLPLMRTVALEGRCVVLSANQCITMADQPVWIAGVESEKQEEAAAVAMATLSLFDEGTTEWLDQPPLKKRETQTDDDFSELSDNVPVSPLKKKKLREAQSEFLSRGGSCIISPLGEVLAGPVWEQQNSLIVTDVDFDDCVRGRLDLDVGGSYSRNDSFHLTVEGLELTPPP